MKGYVGKSNNPRTRFSRHLNECFSENHYRANWLKYLIVRGLRPVLEILDEVPFEHWPQLEVAYIEFFLEQGYRLTNGTPGGEDPPQFSGEKNSFFGRKHTPETCAKIAALQTGRKAARETRERMRAAGLKRTHSEETKEKQCLSHLGKKHKNNTSGFVGVTWNKKSKSWQSTFQRCRKQIHIGLFSKIEDAVFARALAIAIR